MSDGAEGSLVVLEGIDGSGTTTQLERIAAWLAARGVAVVATREPTGGPVGQLLRQALGGRLIGADQRPKQLGWECLALLFAADRMDHNASVIEPAVKAGSVVLSDRYDLSSRIYQSLTAPLPQVAFPYVSALNSRARRPELTIVLDIDAEVAEERRRQRGGEPELFEHRELQRRLAAEYAKAERYVPGDRVVHRDGTPPAETVTASIIEVLEDFFGPVRAHGPA